MRIIVSKFGGICVDVKVDGVGGGSNRCDVIGIVVSFGQKKGTAWLFLLKKSFMRFYRLGLG